MHVRPACPTVASHPPGVLVLLALLLLNNALATCQEPTTAIQVERRRNLEGEVRASVVAFSASGSIDSDRSDTWQANLPSQNVLDNQWYLYILCEEYESGRLSQAQYCEASAGIWERISGRAMPADGCSVESAPAVVSTHSAPTTSGSGVAALQGARSSVRWATNSPESGTFEFFGPLDIDGASFWYVWNGQCLSRLTPSGSGFTEEILGGGRCKPWDSVVIMEQNGSLQVVIDGGLVLMSPMAGAFRGTPRGTWRGAFVNDGSGKPAPIEASWSHTGVDIDWPGTQCRTEWSVDASGPGWWRYTERALDDSCVDGATVVLRALAEDVLLMSWEGQGWSTVGLLRR